MARQEARPAETREDSVSEFGDLEKKAQDYVEEHPDQADKGINEAAGFAERETDHQHDQQIDMLCPPRNSTSARTRIRTSKAARTTRTSRATRTSRLGTVGDG